MRRATTSMTAASGGDGMMPTDETPQDEALPTLPTLAELVQRAHRGDRSVLPALREALQADPSLWQTIGDLAAHTQEAWLQLLAGPDLLLYETVKRQLGALRQEL